MLTAVMASCRSLHLCAWLALFINLGFLIRKIISAFNLISSIFFYWIKRCLWRSYSSKKGSSSFLVPEKVFGWEMLPCNISELTSKHRSVGIANSNSSTRRKKHLAWRHFELHRRQGTPWRDVPLVISSLPSWLVHSPPTAAVPREEGPRDPHGCDQRLPELSGWKPCPQILTSKSRRPEGDWKSWTTCTCHLNRSSSQKPHEERLVLQRGSAELWAPGVCWGLASFGALHEEALSHTTSEPRLGSRARALIADPAFTATQPPNSPEMKGQMTGYRVPRAGSRGFFCRHLAGYFKVFCL